MKIDFTIGDSVFSVEAYNSEIEKELLLASSFDITDLDSIFKILGDLDVSELSELQKKVLLYKYREISLGDEIDMQFKCDNCGQGNDGVLIATDFIRPGVRNDSEIKNLAEEFTEDNLAHYVELSVDEIDELDIDEYEDLLTKVIANQETIELVKEATCLKCKAKKKFDISATSYIIEIMSDDTLMSLYKSYNSLVYFGNYSKLDIDSMYPFERSIFIGLLNKTKEDLAK